MDFLAPHANFSLQVNEINYVADANKIIAGVTNNGAIKALLAAGCVPLTPKGWIDPR